ncbi:hypothetical protein [Paenibacillus polymyxa]|uniref:hypothetical protein n=1 Tax=Paenibacillus polymyxa TaxID=1406 RepID=UPI0011191838|nr:hypothetical protein [Paenibacillus polymyxa]QDA30263.1 hypothetical protein FGY93_25455 [Paenibacillus polymyxa]
MFDRIKFCFRLYQGRSLETVCCSFIFSFLVGLFLYLGHAPVLWLSIDIMIFFLDCLALTRIIWWLKFAGKGTKIYGYYRWDNTIEIHIGKVTSPLEFQRRIRNTIKYAREKGYLIEYTSGILTHGEVIERYGKAVISIKPLSLFGRMINASIAKKYNPPYNVTHPIKVVLDPQKL